MKRIKSSKVVLNILSILTRILVIVCILAGSIIVGKESYKFGYRIFTEEAMTDEAHARKVTLSITSEMSNMDIAQLMVDKGLSKNKLLFFVQLSISDFSKKIEPGIYSFSTDMTPEDIINSMGAVFIEKQKAMEEEKNVENEVKNESNTEEFEDDESEDDESDDDSEE